MTSPTVTTLLNSTALLLSSASLLKATGTKSMNANFESVTPKTLSYKQKRSSERVSNFEETLKTSFQPFYIQNRISNSEDVLTNKNDVVFVKSTSKGDEERILQPNSLSHNAFGVDRKSMYAITVTTRTTFLSGLGSYRSSSSASDIDPEPVKAGVLTREAQFTGYFTSFEFPLIPFMTLAILILKLLPN